MDKPVLCVTELGGVELLDMTVSLANATKQASMEPTAFGVSPRRESHPFSGKALETMHAEDYSQTRSRLNDGMLTPDLEPSVG